ncbi:hypothetical protein Rsub_03261 [Raphidocelis subcapitata]|uniref:DUF1254 domain-containing protein n=1 Tax=Raphidocelis subcapitata TaxID=307507 RepID=A0A2V0NR31_9CHLO|nr:hypothetical protein Rsub_03261 [Raphidocelis subcapitata]|eukprot:GBF90128.1 hypothetical protein Rsub_03261 [Raphidocelis subcapitata]
MWTNPRTLYSLDWLDLEDAGPTVFTFDDSGGRFFAAQAIDAWGNNILELGFACGPDTATGGARGCPAGVPSGDWLLLPPGRKARSLPADVRVQYEGRTLEMPTAAVLLVVRTLADGASRAVCAGAAADWAGGGGRCQRRLPPAARGAAARGQRQR